MGRNYTKFKRIFNYGQMTESILSLIWPELRIVAEAYLRSSFQLFFFYAPSSFSVRSARCAINLFYEAAIDGSLWPVAVTRLADAIGVAQIGLGTFDHRSRAFYGLAPRIPPQMLANYRDYWSSRDPIWPKIEAQAAGALFSSPREEYAATDVYNEWFRLAKIGLSLLGANLRAEDEFLVTIFAANPPGSEQINSEQALAFKAALPHVSRAIKMHRLLRIQEFNRDTAPERLEHAGVGVLLVDRAAKVLFANSWARALLVPGCELALQGGYLFSRDRAAILHRLIAAYHACQK